MHRLIRDRQRVLWYWLPLLVAWYVLAMVLKNWWDLVFAGVGDSLDSGWIFFYYGRLLLLYLVAAAALPDEVPVQGLDLREYYIAHRRQFWGLLAAVNLTLSLYAVVAPLLTGRTIVVMAVVSNLAMGAIALSLALTRRYAYHAIVVVVLAALTVFEIAVKFWR